MRRFIARFSQTTRRESIESFQAILSSGATYNGRYRIIGKLGEGQHATVWQAEDVSRTEPQVAIKVLSTHVTSLQGTAAFEGDILRRNAQTSAPGSRHLLRLLDQFTINAAHGTHQCFVTDLCATKTLDDQQRSASGARLPLPLHFVQRVSRQLLEALTVLHDECHVIHTDIKPDNILFSATDSDLQQTTTGTNFDIILADFGTAIPDDRPRSFPIQPVALRAPEVLLGCNWNAAADIWNVGCLVFELVAGTPLFRPEPYASCSAEQFHFARILATMGEHDDPARLREFFKNGRNYNVFYAADDDVLLQAPPEPLQTILPLYDVNDDQLLHFLTSMLRVLPDDRASARDLLRHPWLNVSY